MVKMEKRKSLIFFLEWMNVLRRYPRMFRWVVIEAICDYQENNEVPDFKSYFTEEEIKDLPDGFISNAETAFSFIKEDIDRNNKRWEDIKKLRRANAEKRWSAYRKSENKKNNMQNMQLHNLHSKATSKGVNVNDNANENVNDNANENVNDNANVTHLCVCNNNYNYSNNNAGAHTHTNERYEKFCEWLSANAPSVRSHFGDLKIEDFERLHARHDAKDVSNIILKLENRPDLIKKYRSLRATVENWLKHEWKDK